MWDRKELKKRAKAAIKVNYWRCVLVALLMTAITAGLLNSARITVNNAADQTSADNSNVNSQAANSADKQESPESDVNVRLTVDGKEVDPDVLADEVAKRLESMTSDGGTMQIVDDKSEDSGVDVRLTADGKEVDPDAVADEASKQIGMLADGIAAGLVVLLTVIVGALLMLAMAAAVVNVLVINPLYLGCHYFFLRNSSGDAEFDNLTRGFAPSWWHTVVTMFLTDLFTVLWSLLFIVPGVIKVYSYRLVPYIQAEHPEMKGTEAITLSRKMMNGQKWNAIVFDLSFLGWEILGKLTFFGVDVLWTRPYKEAANAELYRAISAAYSQNA